MNPRTTSLLIVAAAVAASCAGPTAPTGGPLPQSAAAEPAGSSVSSASDLPPNGVFAIHPNPAAGLVPLRVVVNMCKSTQADPDEATLKYVVDWGDQEKTRGSCRQDHVYERAGRFAAEACVAERTLEPPRTCRRFVVEARSEDGASGTAPIVRTDGPGSIAVSVPTEYVSLASFNEGAPIPLSALQSAQRVAVEVTLTVNTCETVVFGLASSASFVLYEGGAPNLAGMTGTFTYDLTPGQFTQDADSFVIRTGTTAPSCVVSWPLVTVRVFP